MRDSEAWTAWKKVFVFEEEKKKDKEEGKKSALPSKLIVPLLSVSISFIRSSSSVSEGFSPSCLITLPSSEAVISPKPEKDKH